MAVDTDDAGRPAPRRAFFPRPRLRDRASIAAVSLFAVALAIAGAIAWRQHHPPVSPAQAPPPASAAAPVILGAIDTPPGEVIAGTSVHISGWAVDPEGVRAVEIRVDGKPYAARYGISRPDVAQARPGFPDSVAPGFAFDGEFGALGPERHDVSVVAISRGGRESVLGRKGLVPPAALEQWHALYEQRHAGRLPPFYIIPALSAIGLGGASELDTAYDGYLSPTFKVGMRVPILYLRTTLGAAKDWVFDPDWDIERRCGQKRIAEDSLTT